MESLFGFTETPSYLDENHKLVPWLNWDEWDFVRLSLFSSSADSIAKALRRIAAWQSRGCVPVSIEITASIVEIQQKDPYFRVGLSNGSQDSEEILAMLYTMAIVRLVNGVIEETRGKKTSIAKAAAEIGVPRLLIDIRHEGAHRDLPSLPLLRLASIEAVCYMKSYYWDPQKNAIPCQRSKSANIRKEIKLRLRELAISLKLKHSSRSSSQVKGKRAKHHESLIGAPVHGRNKFFSLMASKLQPSVGSRKQLTRTLKNLIRLYTFFSSDVVSVLLEFLLKASNSTNMVDSPENFQINLTLDVAQAVFDEWKPVITKVSKKKPELLLGLLKAVLDMIVSHKAIRDDFGSEHFSLAQFDAETQQIGVLSSLFTTLVLILKGIKSPHNEDQGSQIEAACPLPKPMLIELMRRCLNISDPENQELVGSAVLLGKIAGNSYLNDKLQKLSMLTSAHSRLTVCNPSDMKAENLTHQDKYIRQAAEKLELIKHRKTIDNNVADTNSWTIAKSWNPCPIGMLPRDFGSSGCLPVLDCGVDNEHKIALNSIDEEEPVESRHCGKREAPCDIETIDDSSCKRLKDPGNFDSSEPDDMNVITTSSEGLKGRLLIGGVWQKVGDQELLSLQYFKGMLGPDSPSKSQIKMVRFC